jgi:hypothetical protein
MHIHFDFVIYYKFYIYFYRDADEQNIVQFAEFPENLGRTSLLNKFRLGI